jgi:predicted lipid-binding transport protein (Tim44 family)
VQNQRVSDDWVQDRGAPPSDYQSDAEIEAYVHALTQRDHWFDRGSFMRDCQGVFEDVTRNWSMLDPNASRPWMLDELFAAHLEGIEALRDKDVQPVVDQLSVMDVRITGAWLEDGWDCLLVRFTASSTDYKRGRFGRKIGRDDVHVWTEEWTFAKPYDDLTPRSIAPGEKCPSCGGPGDGSTRCPFCGQIRSEGRGFRDVWKAASIEELAD